MSAVQLDLSARRLYNDRTASSWDPSGVRMAHGCFLIQTLSCALDTGTAIVMTALSVAAISGSEGGPAFPSSRWSRHGVLQQIIASSI